MSDIGKNRLQYEKHPSRIGIQVGKMNATVEGSLFINTAGLANSLSLPIRPSCLTILDILLHSD